MVTGEYELIAKALRVVAVARLRRFNGCGSRPNTQGGRT
jgi:hypothetical protein